MFQTFPTLRESVLLLLSLSIFWWVIACTLRTFRDRGRKKTKYLKPKSWRKIYQWHEKGWKDNWTFGEKQIIHDHKPLADRKVFCHIEAHDQIFLPPRIFAAILTLTAATHLLNALNLKLSFLKITFSSEWLLHILFQASKKMNLHDYLQMWHNWTHKSCIIEVYTQRF